MTKPITTSMTVLRKPSEQQPARTAPLARLPVFFALTGKRVVISGGSAAAAWKAEVMAAAGANVAVYAVDAGEEMRAVAGNPSCGSVTIYSRAWEASDLCDAALAIAACDNDGDAAAFAAAAR